MAIMQASLDSGEACMQAKLDHAFCKHASKTRSD